MRPVSSSLNLKSLARIFFVALMLTLTIGALENPLFAEGQTPRDYVRLVILGDPHLPGNHVENKGKVIETINTWDDTDLVVDVGDSVFSTGTEEEYAFVGKFFAGLKKPLAVITGNHDYVFSTQAFQQDGKFSLASATERSRKLDLFMRTFNLKELNESRNLNGYHLIFLSVQDLNSQTYCQISEEQQKWLDWDLYHNKNLPTIIFFHAPLWGKQATASNPRMAYFVAQPQDQLRTLILKYPQVFLWVCGHDHLGALNPNSIGPVNLFEGKVQVINNCDLDGHSILSGSDIKLEYHDNLWTTSLYLYPQKVVSRVFDHKAGSWVSSLDREFTPPTLPK